MPSRSSGRSRRSILAIQIEKRYTKREIFTLYCNQMYLGHGTYGVEAASRLYFSKSNKDLTLEEAALIAGIVPAARAAEPVRRHEARDRAGATTCCSAWPTSATSPRRRPTPPSRSRSSRAGSRRSRPASRRSSSRRFASISNGSTAPRRCTRAACAVHDDARRRRCRRLRTARSSTACAALDKRRGFRQAEAQRRRGGAHGRRLQGRPLDAADRGRRHRPGRRRHRPARPAPRALRIGRYHADLARDGYRLDPPHLGRGSLQAWRPDRGRDPSSSTRRRRRRR